MEFKPDGSIRVAPAFRRAQASWYQGLAAMARAGTRLILDEVFLDAGNSQARLQRALDGIAVAWVGVCCDPDIAEARELSRGDRIKGLARDQADRVHEGVGYDITADTTDTPTAACATLIADWIEA
jgi:chloramphenicol 3-O phosphotransferase